MKPTLKISQTVISRLSNTQDECYGKLYGIFFKNSFTILGLQVDTECGYNLIHSLPAEMDLCGVFQIANEKINHEWIRNFSKNVDVTDNPIYVSFNLDTQQLSTHFITNEQIESVTYTVLSEQEIYSQFLHVRLQGKLFLNCEPNEKSVTDAFANLRKLTTSGLLAFKFQKQNVFLMNSESENPIIGLSGEPTIADVCEELNNANEGTGRKKKSQHFELDIVNINLLKRDTKQGTQNNVKNHAPICVLGKKESSVLSFAVLIDTLAIVHRQTKLLKLYEILLESAIRNLRLYESVLLDNVKDNEESTGNLKQLETFHFYPSDCGHFFTMIYAKNCEDADLIKKRYMLHKQLLLKNDSPKFRRANRYQFVKNKTNSPLINPHETLKPTDNGGQIALVKGKYQYFHYCQDKMDDNGWGCAYRSLQTLASWFKTQGFVDKEVPTFKEIQKCLVDIGDKPRNFINSKQWIGSTEVNYVLNTLLGVTSKILYVSSGEEMATKGPELVNHFETHGSPIMIGGGVLAHTILGVDYNQQTGNLKFLILDPHYTGGEDLNVIQSKGWCGWKGVDFWNKTAYYNMCLPQVPRQI